jgi:reductive dehalogenase
MKLFSNRKRPLHLGPFPLERLPRIAHPVPATLAAGRSPTRSTAPGFAGVVQSYLDTFLASDNIPVSGERVALQDDPAVATREIKAACYFFDASLVGVCQVNDDRWAVVLLVEYGREPEPGTLASTWIAGAADACAAFRGAGIATVVASYIRQLGFTADVHAQGKSDVDLAALAWSAGLVERQESGSVAPFLGDRFATATVVTSLPLAPDRPLVVGGATLRGMSRLVYWLGLGGTRSARECRRLGRRQSHLGSYPMEKIRRRDTPTTLVFEDEVPRIPLRAAFFDRAAHGDLGEKAQRERQRFATKHPLAYAMARLTAAMVPLQDGQPAPMSSGDLGDPVANARAVKSLSYFLGCDAVGICEARPYAWYSHDGGGNAIDARHRYAIVLLIDQGHDTSEGASGDDWISGAQSLRAYLRGAELAGLVAEHIRRLGLRARAHTNRDSQVLHLPLVLWAGLGELSRIGELVLHPFLGPRSKSVVVTTDMPLAVDRPIDFGLQDTCTKCRKCARECPCNAISYKSKVMFNGYEIWKPDVERCTRYRVTNPKGSSCGRCMKVCPFANEGLLTHRILLWAAVHVPFTRRWLVRLDDLVRHGERNPIKKWWRDLERRDDGTVHEPWGANARDLDLAKRHIMEKRQDIAYYPAGVMPSPDLEAAYPIDRRAALEEALETPLDALRRRAAPRQ